MFQNFLANLLIPISVTSQLKSMAATKGWDGSLKNLSALISSELLLRNECKVTIKLFKPFCLQRELKSKSKGYSNSFARQLILNLFGRLSLSASSFMLLWWWCHQSCGCYCCHGIEVIVLIIADVVGNIVIDGVDVAIVTVVVAVIRSRYGCRSYFCGSHNC